MMRGYWVAPNGPFAHHIGGVGIAGFVLMIILWIAVIALIVIGIRALILHSRRNKAAAAAASAYPSGTGPGATPSANSASLLVILEERYARGEIGRDDFLQRKQDLGLGGQAVPPPAPPATPPETTV